MPLSGVGTGEAAVEAGGVPVQEGRGPGENAACALESVKLSSGGQFTMESMAPRKRRDKSSLVRFSCGRLLGPFEE